MHGPLLYDHCWMNVFALLRDQRVLRMTEDHYALVTPDSFAEDLPITRIILVDELEAKFADTLYNMASNRYPNLTLVFVLPDPGWYKSAISAIACVKHMLPKHSVFRPKKRLNLIDGYAAGLQSVETPYFCLSQSGDLVHPLIFYRVAAEFDQEQHVYCEVGQGLVGGYNWTLSWFPTWLDQFMVMKTDAVIKAGGFQRHGEHPYGAIWELQRKLYEQPGFVLNELLVYRAAHARDERAPKWRQQFDGGA